MPTNSQMNDIQKKSFKKNLFEVVFMCNNNQIMKKEVNLLMFTANVALNMLIFLSFKTVDLISESTLKFSFLINVILASLFGLVLVEIIIGLVYQIQFMIATQLKIIRFLLYPFFGRYFLQQTINSSSIASFSIFTFLFISLLVLSMLLISQFYKQTHIYSPNYPLNAVSLIMQTSLYALQVVNSSTWQVILSCVMVLGCAYVRLRYFSTINNQSAQFRILSLGNFLFLIYAIILTFQSFKQIKSIQNIVVMTVIVIIFQIYVEFTRRKIIPRDFSQIFHFETLCFQQFMKHCQYIVDQVNIFNQPNHPPLCQSIIFTFFSVHQKHCTMSNCNLKIQNYQEEFSDYTNPKVLKKLISKILRKIQIIFEEISRNEPENLQLKLSFIKFYAFLLPNKIKVLQLTSEIEQMNFNFTMEYQLFRFKKIADLMQNTEIIDNLKKDDVVNDFQRTAYSTVNSITQFWHLFNEQKIDLQKVMKVSQKLLTLKKKIHRQWQKSMKEQKFSTLKIVILYAHFLKYVLYDHQAAVNLEYFARTLQQRLAHKKQIKYLSFGSQSGLIGASLTDNNLGRIVIANSQASNIFGYSRNQINKIRLNDIMPKIFAEQHDNYMIQFYKNRHKKINSDQRLLVGKDKFGFVILIMLQLQRTIGTLLNDELLFVANIKKFKAKQSPIVCITDEQGQINDMSSPFRQIFFQHKDKKKPLQLNKNIQQIIPDFFDITRDPNLKNSFSQQVQSEKCGSLKINFNVIPMCFPLKPNGGFIIIGSRQKKSFQNAKVDCFQVTKDIQYKIQKGGYNSNKMFYNPQKNMYEFDSKKTKIIPQSAFKQQFYTIPFINLNDISNIFKMKNQEKNYGQGIRTLRLMDSNHLIRVQDLDTFQSEFLPQEDKIQSFNFKFRKIKEDQLENDANQKAVALGRIIIGIISLLLIFLPILLMSKINVYQQANLANLSDIQFKYQVRGYLPQYILSFQAYNSGFDNTYYSNKVINTTHKLLNVIQNSNIQQAQKESILKIFYLKTSSDLINLLSSDILTFDYKEINQIQQMNKVLISIQGILVALILVVIVAVMIYWAKVQQIFGVFLLIEEKTIKKIYHQCQNFEKLVQQNNTQNHKKRKQEDKTDENEQNSVNRRKTYKKGSQKKRIELLLKLFIPIGVLILVSGFFLIFVNLRSTSFKQQFQLRMNLLSFFPQSSVAFLNKYLKSYKNQASGINEVFNHTYQHLQRQVFMHESNHNKITSDESLFSTLLGDACKNEYFSIHPSSQISKICKNFTDGVMQNGLSIVINEILLKINDLSLSNTYSYSNQFTNIYMLQYEFAIPLILQMSSLIQNQLINDIKSFVTVTSTLLIIYIFLIVFNSIYISEYMFKQMKIELSQKKQLLLFLPNINEEKNQLKNEKNSQMSVNEKGNKNDFQIKEQK